MCIIEDDPDIRKIYKTAFKKENYNVVMARNGEEGLEVLRKEKPDVALVDILMPQ